MRARHVSFSPIPRIEGHPVMALRVMLALTTVVAVGALAACTSSSAPSHEYKPAAAPRVALAVGHRGEPSIKIGLVRTSGDGNEGSEVDTMSTGALVAAYRINAAHARTVSVEVVDDHGTAAGSKAAMTTLVRDGVSGAVYASVGTHLTDGLEVATQAGMPVLLPYELSAGSTPAETTSTVWRTGPSQDQAAAALVNQLRSAKLSRTLVVVDGSQPAAITDLAGSAGPLAVTGTGSQLVTGLTTRISNRASRTEAFDSAVVWGSAATEARVVASLEQADLQVPIVLSPQAVFPTFADSLADMAKHGGLATASGQFATVGEAQTDFSPSMQNRAFLAGLRAAAAEGRSHGAVAADADRRSHDAVIALATAVDRARSSSHAAVVAALRALQLSAKQGLAGSPLDFRGQDAVASGDIAGLRSTMQSSGERSALGDSSALAWFAPGTDS